MNRLKVIQLANEALALRAAAATPVGAELVDATGVAGHVYSAGPWLADRPYAEGWRERFERREPGRLPNPACDRDLRRLQAHYPEVRGALTVGTARLASELRGKGLGLALYRRNVEAAAEAGYALAPNLCNRKAGLDEGQTSADALRVWERLTREYPHEGLVVWGKREGALNASKTMVEPPASARRIAKHALEVRASLPPSRRGGLSPTEAGRQGVGSGVRRAQDIVAGRRVDAGQVDRFCKRFEGREREAERRGLALEDSRVRQAWDLWGGDPMCRAAARAFDRAGR